jgi:hypothetical protein
MEMLLGEVTTTRCTALIREELLSTDSNMDFIARYLKD